MFEFTTFQKQIIDEIINGKILSLSDFIKQFTDHDEKTIQVTPVEINPELIIKNLENERPKLLEFTSLIDKLSIMRLITLHRYPKTKVFLHYLNNGNIVNLHDFETYLSIVYETDLHPQPELSTFVKNKYITTDELRLIKSEKRTFRLHVVTILIAIFSIMSNLYVSFHKTEKDNSTSIIHEKDKNQLKLDESIEKKTFKN